MAPETEYKIVAEGLGFTEGPVWTRDGRLLVTSISHGKVYDVGLGRKKSRVLADTSGGPNGMTEGANGSLYVAQNSGMHGLGDTSPERAEAGIQVVEGVSVRYRARGLDAPHDCCFGPDGRLYFTDPRGPANPEKWSPGRVYAMSLDGDPAVLTEGPAFTNGIAFGPDATELYVAETFRRRVLVYPFTGGGLGEPREFCKTDPGFPDGLCFDADGSLYVAATFAHAVLVFDRSGQQTASLPCGDDSLVTNCCFGGKDGKTLFVTDSAGERVLSFNLSVSGLPLFPFR
jgi:gluconolactonase